MPNTDEFWSINGTSLHEYCWSIATVGGSRYNLPPRRGENVTLARRPGQIHKNKVADARPMSLLMWVAGMHADGRPGDDQTLQWNDNWDALRRLVWTVEGRQFTLTRRWRLTQPTLDPEVAGDPGLLPPGPQIVVADALAEVISMDPSMTGRTRADFEMQLLLASPYFYGSQITVPLNVGVPRKVYNPGHDIAAYGYLEIEFKGPLTNPRLWNTSVSPEVWVQFNGTIPNGITLRLNVDTYQLWTDAVYIDIFPAPPGAFKPYLDNISHYGSEYWMGLQPGLNTITLTASSGTGTATLRYRPPYV